jgi:hypothetical protein
MREKPRNFEGLKKFILYPEKGKTGAAFLRDKIGVYLIYLNDTKNLLYIGKASTDLEDVITRHFQNGNRTQVKFKQYANNPVIKYICKVFLTHNANDAHKLEAYLIERLQPKLNKQLPAEAENLSRYKQRKRNDLQMYIDFKLSEATGEKEDILDFDGNISTEEVPF